MTRSRRAARRQALRMVALCAASSVLPALAQSPSLTISTNNTPLDRRALQGLAQEACHRIGVDFKLVSLPSERSLLAADAGEVDGEGLRVAGLEDQYHNLLRVPERFVATSFVAFARTSSNHLERGWDSLRPYRVAYINGWKMFEANAGSARTVYKVDKPEQMFQMLEHDHVDLVLYTRADGVSLARKLGLSGVAPLTPSLKEVDLYLYLNKKHAALVPKLARALKDMKADGTHDRIMSAIAAE
jgi:polar amino acid transport system substrate-binding protein